MVFLILVFVLLKNYLPAASFGPLLIKIVLFGLVHVFDVNNLKFIVMLRRLLDTLHCLISASTTYMLI
uniref:Uncharacterized protein n=1 Tax=Panstrongylus lignarius TaxID=156445 RepID=A0A224XUY2_9HEMI